MILPISCAAPAIVKRITLLTRVSRAKSGQKVPLTTKGFETIRYFRPKEEKDGKKGSIHLAGGPLTKTMQEYRLAQSYVADNPEALYPDDVVYNWQPHMSLSVYDAQHRRALTAAEISERRQLKWVPHYFVNPMQDLDYLTIEALARFTIIGPIMEALAKFEFGNGFKPQLELINPSNDKDSDKKEIEAHQDIIDDLLAIDNQLSMPDTGETSAGIDVSFQDKIFSLINCTNIFNRSALIFDYNRPLEIRGKKYADIPDSVKFAHARDLGIIDVDPGSWRLKAVQWRNAFYMIPAKDMIYLWNPQISSKTRGSWLYGESMVSPMLDAARTIRKNIGVNFPAMAEVGYAGAPVIFVKPQGQTVADKEKEYGDLLSKYVRGAPNVFLKDPLETRVDNIDFNPRVNEFKDLTEALIKYCVACQQIPHSLFYDEDSSNRATMIGKIQLAIAVTVNPLRSVMGRMIANQWYQRWFTLLCRQRGQTDLLKKFRVNMVFSDLHIEEWFDKIEAVNNLDSRKQLTDEAYGELAGIEQYKNKVEADALVTPGGSGGGKSFKFGDEKQGFEIKDTSSFRAKAQDPELNRLRKTAYKKFIAKLDEE